MALMQLVGAAEGFRQGDVVRFTPSEGCPYGATLGVILTADCDLSQGKHYGQALLCPIVSACTYFNEIWCVKKLNQSRTRITERANTLLKEAQAKGLLDPVSLETVDAIISTENAMRSALVGISGLARGTVDELVRLAGCIEMCDEEQTCIRDRLVGMLAHKDTKSMDVILKNNIDQFKRELNQDSMDVIVTEDVLNGTVGVQLILLRCPFSFSLNNIHRKSIHGIDVPLRIGGGVANVVEI